MSRRKGDRVTHGPALFVWPAVVFVVGVAAAVVVAEGVGVPGKDAVKLLVESLVGSAAAGAVAMVVLVLLRRSSVVVQATVAALAPVAAVAIGVTWATSNMFITSHDLRTLWVVLVAAGAGGVASSLMLGRRVADASRSVTEMARRLGESGPVALAAGADAGSRRPSEGPGELAALARELRRTSDLLAAAQLKAEATERSRRELLAWVSHDLRTPLSGIRAMTEALEDGVVCDAPTIRRYYATIRLEADHLAALVDDLFELSQIQAGGLSLRRVPVPLDDVLADALAGAAVAARAKGVRLERESLEPGPVVEVAASEMIRVVRNLLDNAIRHTGFGGAVTVTSTVADGSVHLSVLDQCGGIPEHELARVFDLGYRGDEARSPGAGRGGLGLAVAQGLVHAHAGDIRVHNEATGCRFTVTLPLHARPVQSATG